jgi:hypothetical protein
MRILFIVATLLVAAGCGDVTPYQPSSPGGSHGGGGGYQPAYMPDMAPQGPTGQVRVKWTVDGQNTGAYCPRTDTSWVVLVDGVMHGLRIDCYQDPWDSGILSVPLGGHTFTVQLKDALGNLVGTKTAAATVSTTDPNTIVPVTIAFTSADF